MKNIILAIAIVLGASSVCSAMGIGVAQIPIDINIEHKGEGGGNGPRTPFVSPVIGVVNGDVIYLAFTTDVGDVSVRLEEETEGQLLTTVVDSSEGDVEIPFSGAVGNYTITFNLSDGTRLRGAFIIYV